MKQWRKFVDSKYFYIILSFLLAIWIFFSVSAPNMGSTRNSSTSNDSSIATKAANVSMNLQIDADTSNYFVTGYPKKVKVQLQGPAALVTATKNTQNFTTYVDLKNLGIGYHKIKIKQTGLNRELKYSIKPKYVDIDIEPKQVKTFPVQTSFNESAIAKGYEAGHTTVDHQVVQVTGAESEVQKISQVVAKVDLPKDTKSEFHQEVLLQALDSNGHTLSVIISPQTVDMKIPVALPSKKVSLKFEQKGNSDKHYAFSSDTSTVKIYAKKSVLNKIDQLNVPVNTDKLDKDNSTTISISSLNSDIIDSSPRLIKVTANPVDNQNNEDQ